MLNLFEVLQIYTEMAYEKKKILADIRHSDRFRIEHLTKVFLYRELRKQDLKHWIRGELYPKYAESPLIKGNKHLSYKELYRAYWDEPKDDVNERRMKAMINSLISNGYPNIEYSFSNLYNFIKDFTLWVIRKLADEYYLSDVNEFENKIMNLLDKYSIK